VMTLEGWVEGVSKPVMVTHPFAWIFFITFIVVTTFMILNLFIGIVVNAMQIEHDKEAAAERSAERAMIAEQTQPLVAELRGLKGEVEALRAELAGKVRSRAS